jgi:hypothetical protein
MNAARDLRCTRAPGKMLVCDRLNASLEVH